ncbi:hypothetical protein EDC01DRAFT_306082 [Geopyxis carbonaria]|nr:hypothetical protein EDC01DRAFT_306082 [Geopyxis carbonaria]
MLPSHFTQRISSLRPLSSATSIDATSDIDTFTPRRSLWQSRKTTMLQRPALADDDEVSDAESFASLSSRAKFMSDMLSDSDSSIDGRQSVDGGHSLTTISSEGPGTPRSPAPEYQDEEYTFVLEASEMVMDEKHMLRHERSRSMMDCPPYYAAEKKEMEMSTVGPVGPHLFRSYSTSHAPSVAPITIPSVTGYLPPSPTASGSFSPRHLAAPAFTQHTPPSDAEPIIFLRPASAVTAAHSDYDLEEVRSWTTEQVCMWLSALGFDSELVSKFQSNDITGAILIDLKWADLKELEINSFGKRIELWTEIHHLRARTLPTPRTPAAEAAEEFVRPSSRTASRAGSVRSPVSPRGRSGSNASAASQMMVVREPAHISEEVHGVKALPDLPTLLPRRNRSIRQQEIISEADEEDTDIGSRSRSRSSRPPLRRKARKNNVRMPRRQVSVDSIIITSEDGEDFPTSFARHVKALSRVDPDVSRPRKKKTHHCKKHTAASAAALHSSDDNAAVAPKAKRPHKCSKGGRCRKHRSPEEKAKRLSPEHGMIVIATTPSIADDMSPRPQSMSANSVLASSDVLGPIHSREIKLQESVLREIGRVDPLENVKTFLTHQHLQHLEERRDSPPPVPSKSASDMARAHSTSPPPTRSHTAPPAALAPAPPAPFLHANASHATLPTPLFPPRANTPSFGLRSQGMERAQPPSTLNFNTPSRVLRTTTPFSEADVPVPCSTPAPVLRNASASVPPDMASYRLRHATPTPTSLARPLHPVSEEAANEDWETIAVAPSPHMRTHSGWMKKRRTHWFRHEWPDYHFVLRGTQLAYAKDVATGELGSINMDDYQVACTTSGSTKLAAALRAGRIFGRKKDDPHGAGAGSYFFQLVPAAPTSSVKEGARRGVGKAHHFAVGSREERIDWMRELMLAKAIKQKKRGFEVEVNGELV